MLSLNDIPNIHAQIASPIESIKCSNSFDIFHYIGGPTYKSVLLLGICKIKNKELCTILTFTNPYWGLLANVLISFFQPDHVLVASRYWSLWAQKRKLKNSTMSISGVDAERFIPINLETRDKLRQKLNLPKDKIIALHVGHLKRDRNLQLLLEAQKGSNIQVVIIGSTTTEQCTNLVMALEEAGCLIIRDYQPQIEHFYQTADCYIFPTIDPKAAVQIPLSVLEAMAVGIPVIATPFGGLPCLFKDKEGLLFIDETDALDGGLADKVNLMVNSKQNNNGIIREYSWMAIAEKLAVLYQKLIMH